MRRDAGRLVHRVTSLPEFSVVVFAFLLNFPWEFLQTPLFQRMVDAPHWEAVKICSTAALGDAVIMLAAYWVVAIVRGARDWIVNPTRATVASFCGLGVMVTIGIERLAVSGRWVQAWTYSDAMPLVPGIGVGASPLVQWLVLPPLVVWFVRRQLLGARA